MELIPVHMKATEKCENYRTISSTTHKALLKITCDGLYTGTISSDPVPKGQAESVKGRGTREQTSNPMQLIEKVKEDNEEMFFAINRSIYS